jgi:hypothetical protein
VPVLLRLSVRGWVGFVMRAPICRSGQLRGTVIAHARLIPRLSITLRRVVLLAAFRRLSMLASRGS